MNCYHHFTIEERTCLRTYYIVFFSLGKTGFTNKKYYQILRDAKQLQHKSDNILLICFVGCEDDNCQIDWVYFEGKHEYNEASLKMYEDLECLMVVFQENSTKQCVKNV